MWFGAKPEKQEDIEMYEKSIYDYIRNIRNAELAETDKFMSEDFPISEEYKQKIKEYRNELRSLPEKDYVLENEQIPDSFFPTPPESADE